MYLPGSTFNVESAYDMWLSGLSIRKIAKHLSIGRGKVWKMFTSHYGKDACNLRKQSLARVVYQEYGDRALAERARGVEGLFRSEQTMANYSKNNSSISDANDNASSPDVLIDYVANITDYHDHYEDVDRVEIGLNVYLWITRMTCKAIFDCQLYNHRMEVRLMKGDCRD